ncbi:hypothetical protein [Methanoregula formicica]|nr:hypothetical protein [Methanoregula formicica]
MGGRIYIAPSAKGRQKAGSLPSWCSLHQLGGRWQTEKNYFVQWR